ncbi:phage tail spike protein [Paenibacillus sp. HJGM_3]
MQKVAYLENADAISYEQPMNKLWKASFTLPANDPKNANCVPFYFVEVFDDRERVELFRIMPSTAIRSQDGQTITYECEHVLGTLIDDILYQFHTVGNLGVYTSEVIQYVLSRQLTARWQLGAIEFDRQFEYNWENENLLSALYSIPSPFVEEYMWTWDTTVYPWTLNLVMPPSIIEAEIRYAMNLRGIDKQVDPRGLCTRLYGLGYGEGVNQLSFADLNSGLPYLDADTQSQFGVISDVYVDRRIMYPETLLARCQAILEERKIPRVSYTVNAADLSRLTDQPVYKFRSGQMVRVKDEEMGVSIVARIVNKRKPNLYGTPGEVNLEISNKPINVVGLLADLTTKQRINDTYAQGATNVDSHDFADNCDPTHPAVLRFWVPEEAVRINKVTLSYRSEAFRAYSRSIEAAPATTSGSSSSTTTESAPAATSGASSTTTTSAGGAATSGPSSTTTTASGGAIVDTDSNVQIILPGINPLDRTDFSGFHNHGLPNGVILVDKDGGWHTFLESGDHTHALYNHAHRINVPSHTHNMEHTHNVPPHIHEMPHTHQIPAHSHGMEHTHQIPAHTHEIQYGIFEGATPTTIFVTVDGSSVPGLNINEEDVDLISFLSKDGSGKVQRGTWHEIKITPNDLGRIIATVNTQIFVQSRGGGNY